MSPVKLAAELERKLGGKVRVVQEQPDLVVEVRREDLLEVAAQLKEAPELAFDSLLFITAVDRVDYLEVIYGLRSLKELHQLLVKVPVDEDDLELPSVTSVWPAANLDERETYDLLGVRFKDHPYLERILLDDDWEGHPLRKDYRVDQRPAKIY